MFSMEVYANIQKERHDDFRREAQSRSLARQAQANRPAHRWNWLTQLFAAPAKPAVEPVSPYKTVELPAVTTQELRIWEVRRAMYHRIAAGNALADAEDCADNLRTVQQPC
jgi:hypothetical protein